MQCPAAPRPGAHMLMPLIALGVGLLIVPRTQEIMIKPLLQLIKDTPQVGVRKLSDQGHS